MWMVSAYKDLLVSSDTACYNYIHAGLYTGHPADSQSRLIRTYYPEHAIQVSFWEKSRVGLGGMENKVGPHTYSVTMYNVLAPSIDPQLQSAVSAVEGGTPVVIANGIKGGEVILDVLRGKQVGTLITSNGHSEVIESAEQLAESSKISDMGILAVKIFLPKHEGVAGLCRVSPLTRELPFSAN